MEEMGDNQENKQENVLKLKKRKNINCIVQFNHIVQRLKASYFMKLNFFFITNPVVAEIFLL